MNGGWKSSITIQGVPEAALAAPESESSTSLARG